VGQVRIWVALALALAGLVLIVELWEADRPDAAGLAAAGVAALTYASYILLAERGVRRRDPVSLSAWGFFFATVFWSVLAPWWDFPGGRVDEHVSLLGNLASSQLPVWALMVWMVVLGTIVPFGLLVAALRHITATRAGVMAMLEPVLAIIVAWLWLGESLDLPQLSGAAATLAGIALAQTSR
jgi:drug/metabolite transporter (DMT)-like permease